MSSSKLIQFLGLATVTAALQVSVTNDQQYSAAGGFVQISASRLPVDQQPDDSNHSARTADTTLTTAMVPVSTNTAMVVATDVSNGSAMTVAGGNNGSVMVPASTGSVALARPATTTADHVVLFAQRFRDFVLSVYHHPQDVIERTMVRRTTEISLFKFQKNNIVQIN